MCDNVRSAVLCTGAWHAADADAATRLEREACAHKHVFDKSERRVSAASVRGTPLDDLRARGGRLAKICGAETPLMPVVHASVVM